MTGAAAATGLGLVRAGHAPGAIVVTSSTPLWYVTRATGLVALILLTTGMALGLLIAVRYEGRNWPRFITIGLHRNMALLALAFTAVHVLTTISDNFVPIDLQDAFVPFISPYRPFWLGLGAIALDLLIALTVTSLLRTRLGHRSWRLVHWTAYLCWPVAVLHGLGTGTDTRTRWVLVVTLLCVAAIAGLLGWRLAQGWPANPRVRVAGAIALVVTLVAGGAWLVTGPLRPGWTGRLGLPGPVRAVSQPARGPHRAASAAYSTPAGYNTRVGGSTRAGYSTPAGYNTWVGGSTRAGYSTPAGYNTRVGGSTRAGYSTPAGYNTWVGGSTRAGYNTRVGGSTPAGYSTRAGYRTVAGRSGTERGAG